MKRASTNRAGMALVVVAMLAGSSWAQNPATQPAGEFPQTGTVTGNNVYVRSGPNQNYYPVTKLHRGDKVTVVGKQFGWFEIVPPSGLFSLADKTFIDRVNDETGVLNDDNWVLTGSLLSDRAYAKQVKLAKGTRVKLIGESTTGDYYKIEPPTGATVWMTADYVKLTNGAVTDDKEEALEPIPADDVTLTGSPSGPTTRPAQREALTTRPIGKIDKEKAEAKYQQEITVLEAEMAVEFAKPVSERKFGTILKKLRPMAEQDEDPIAKVYADYAIKYLQNQNELAQAVQDLSKIKTDATLQADEIAMQRQRIQANAISKPDDIVARGRIMVSGIYSNRWRLVEWDSNRTLAYLEVPKGSPIDPVQYYGYYVGIRANARRLLPGSVNPVPIYTVVDIVTLDKPNGRPTPPSMTPIPAVPRMGSMPGTQPATTTQPTGGAG